MDLVADPGGSALLGVPGLRIVGRGDHCSARREIVLPPPGHLLFAVGDGARELLHPHRAQDGDGRHLLQPSWRRRREDGFEQAVSVSGDLPGEGAPLLLVGGQSVGVDPRPVAFLPRRVHRPAQPIRRGRGECFQHRPQRLADELQAVEAADRGQHVCRVRALPPAGADQPQLGETLQQQVQDPRFHAMRQQPVPEPGQHCVVEAGVGQLQAQQVLHVDPCPHRVRGLAISQVLGELQDADQGQPAGRDPGPPPDPEGRLEILIREQRTEAVPDPHGQTALGERRASHFPRQGRNLRSRVRAHRHRRTPSSPRPDTQLVPLRPSHNTLMAPGAACPVITLASLELGNRVSR